MRMKKKAIDLCILYVVSVQGDLCVGGAFDDLLRMKDQVIVGPSLAGHRANHDEIRSFVDCANVFVGGVSLKTAKATGHG
jgi:hypothetical protein